MTQKQEYVCECGRMYIFFSSPSDKPKKCSKCARVLKLVKEINTQQPRSTRSSTKSLHQIPRNASINSMDETWECEYKFNKKPQKEEVFTIGKLLRKIVRLFFPGRRSRRY